jgi:HYPK UBA domain
MSQNTLLLTLNFFYCRVNVITVAPADILAFSEECEVSKEHAELFLKKFGGDMKSALTAFIRG